MKSETKFITSLVLVFFMNVSNMAIGSAETRIKPGASCSIEKQEKVINGKVYTCSKIGKSKTWKIKAVVKTAPQPTKSASASKSPAPVPTTSDEQTRILKAIATAKSDGSYYQELTSCHSYGIIAVLQRQAGQSWIDVAPVQGWLTIGTKCFQPWTTYRSPPDQILRWRLTDPGGSWEVFSDPFTANRIL